MYLNFAAPIYIFMNKLKMFGYLIYSAFRKCIGLSLTVIQLLGNLLLVVTGI